MLTARGVKDRAVVCPAALNAAIEAGGGRVVSRTTDADLVVVVSDIPLVEQKSVAQALESGVPIDSSLGLFFRSIGAEDWDHYDRVPRVMVTPSPKVAHGLSSLLAASKRVVQSSAAADAMGLETPDDGSFVVLSATEVDITCARSLTPDVVVLRNGLGDRLVREGGPDHAVLGVQDFAGAFLANATREIAVDDRVIAVRTEGKISGPGWSVFLNKGFVTEMRKGRQASGIDVRDLDLSSGVVFVYAAARALGMNPREIGSILASGADRLSRDPG